MSTNFWNIKLFPKPVGSTANRSFPDTSVEITSFCSAHNSRDIPSSHKHLRDSLRAESKLTTPLLTELAMFLTCTNETKLTDRQSTSRVNLHQSETLFVGEQSFLKEQWPQAGKIFFAPPLPVFFLLPIIHPLGKTLFLSPVFHCMKNSTWWLNFLRCEHSLKKLAKGFVELVIKVRLWWSATHGYQWCVRKLVLLVSKRNLNI